MDEKNSIISIYCKDGEISVKENPENFDIPGENYDDTVFSILIGLVSSWINSRYNTKESKDQVLDAFNDMLKRVVSDDSFIENAD